VIADDLDPLRQRFEMERIGKAHGLKQRPQFVIAIRALPENLERPVDLGE
jgi:hypothetical protein